jgi:hypothetical protein
MAWVTGVVVRLTRTALQAASNVFIGVSANHRRTNGLFVWSVSPLWGKKRCRKRESDFKEAEEPTLRFAAKYAKCR